MIIMGLDLGKTGDPSALCMVEPVVTQTGIDLDNQPILSLQKHVRHLQRWQLGTRYLDIIARVAQLAQSGPVQAAGGYRLIVDGTGVGVAVVEMIRAKGLICTPVTIVAGHSESFNEETGFWNVSKYNLVSSVVMELEAKTLKFAQDITEREAVIKELLNFKMKITKAGNDTYEAWRDKEHDDLVLALCLALWGAKRQGMSNVNPKRARAPHPLASPALRGII